MRKNDKIQVKKIKKIIRSARLLYCSPFIWKKSFLFLKHPVMKFGEKYVFYRSSVVPRILAGTKVKIYSGKKWNLKKINKWMVGFKFGEFTWNRRLAVYKAKQLRKKKKK